MTVIYYEDAGDLEVLSGKVISVIGYNALARSVALNLRDSGLLVQIGVDAPESQQQAADDNFKVMPIELAAGQSQLLMLLLSDEVMPQVYLEKVSPRLTRDTTLVFASGYNVAFGFIEPPPFVDVVMIAPRTVGPVVRERFESNQGFYSFIGVGQDASGAAWQKVLALALGMGALRSGAVELTLEQEAELDLFSQQVTLPVLHHLVTTAARLLLKVGYPPEAVMLELYISGELTDYLQRAMKEGLLTALRETTLTGQYGIFSRLERFSDLKLERLMETTLDEIRDGDFAQEWSREYADGYPRLQKLLKQQQALDLWEMEQQTIELLDDFDDFEDFADDE